TFTWHIVNGQCVGEDDVVMHFNQDPIPYAGNDTIVCGNEIDLLVEHSIPGTSLEWSGNAYFDPETGTNTTATVASPGVYYFTLTEYNGSCFGSDDIKVTFVQGPQPYIVNQIDTVCGTNYNLSVQNVSGSGVWTAFEDGTQIYPVFDDPTDQNTQVSIASITGEYSTVEFVWTETNSYESVQCINSTSCEVTFCANVYAQAGLPDQIEECGSEVTFYADTIGLGLATGVWIIPDVTGFYDDNTIPDATFTMTSMGSYGDTAHVTFPAIWSVSNGGCQDLDTVYVTMYQKPNANAGNDDSICGLSYDLEAFYDIEPAGNYQPYGFWYEHPDNTGAANFQNNDTAVTTVNVNEPGEYRFIWRENNSLFPNCNDRDTITILFKEKPVIDAGDDFDVCGQNTTMDAVTAGFVGTWLPEPGVVFNDINDPHSDVNYIGGYGSVDLIWQESNDECTSHDTVTVTFWQKPTAELAMDPEDTAVCGRKFRLRAENPGSGVNGNWISFPSNSVDFYFQTYDDTVEVTYYGYYDFYWTESNHPDNEP
ncbi:MAG: hypothetical protein U9Q98_11180, partial [Bacteroidota bacterium]|nr:hypothetical protein [Bacteroidota bacterium]